MDTKPDPHKGIFLYCMFLVNLHLAKASKTRCFSRSAVCFANANSNYLSQDKPSEQWHLISALITQNGWSPGIQQRGRTNIGTQPKAQTGGLDEY